MKDLAFPPCCLHVPASPALVAAPDQVVLLHAVREELRPAQGEPDFGQELGQEGLPLVSVVPDPGQGSFKHLPGDRSGKLGVLGYLKLESIRLYSVFFSVNFWGKYLDLLVLGSAIALITLVYAPPLITDLSRVRAD